MSFFDDLVGQAKQSVGSKGKEIGDYLGSVLVDTFVKIGEPKKGNPTPAEIQANQSSTQMSRIMTLALPLSIGAIALTLLLRKK